MLRRRRSGRCGGAPAAQIDPGHPLGKIAVGQFRQHAAGGPTEEGRDQVVAAGLRPAALQQGTGAEAHRGGGRRRGRLRSRQ